MRDRDEFVLVTLVVWLVSGLGVWLIGPAQTVHIGVSGIIFGYLGFLLLRGFFDGKLTSILIALAVGVAYGGVLWGVLPLESGVSWQGHLFGFIGGGIAARIAA
jgi:membrane associated rhomboid family serine protease